MQEQKIKKQFTENDRQKFRGLLEMAAKSSFEGERRNALAAAERLAKRYGMSLDEAAMDTPPQTRQKPPKRQKGWSMKTTGGTRRFAHLSEAQLQAEKQRREEAIKEAQEKGLDAAERRARKKSARVYRFSPKKRDPESHALALLAETSIPMVEIATITGLDIYDIAGMRLKMRGKRRQY